MPNDESPYAGVPQEAWLDRTEELLAAYPVPRNEVVEIVLDQWESIFETRVGRRELRLGEHIFPSPQILASYLHELIPYELQARYPRTWRRDQSGTDKDLVNIEDDRYSTEIKTSSHRTQIFGNRSYGQPGVNKKTKSGFYMTVNFESWARAGGRLPSVRIIRLGWLDYTDWIAQTAATGQQARVQLPAYGTKLVELFRQ